MLNNGYQTVGTDTPRLESWEKVTGRGRYTDDCKLPNMAYGAILHSPHAHARVLAIDVQQALELTGVIAVLLPEEVREIVYNSSGNPPSDLLPKDEHILTDTPLFAGDRVLAVAAESPLLCEKALSLIQVTYEKLPAVLDIAGALRKGAAALHPEVSPTNLAGTVAIDYGDVEQAMRDADILVEDTFYTPAIAPVSMEPAGCICDYRANGEITVIGTSQTVFQDRRLIAQMAQLPENKVRVVKPLMGGGFGARQQLHHQPVGVWLSKKIGRPVKMIFTREQENLATTVRHAAQIKMRIGANRDGNIVAVDVEAHHDTGAYATHGLLVLSSQSKKMIYHAENYRYRGHCVYTNNVTAGAMRGYGNPQLTFAREVLMNRLAKKLSMDPVELRLKNIVKTGDVIRGTETGINSCELRACAVEAEKIRQSLIRQYRRPGEREEDNWGVAFTMHTTGPSGKTGLSSAVITVNGDGSVHLKTGSADIGQGSETVFAQIAAEILGIDLSRITVTAADTAVTPYDTGTFASSQTFVGGNAVVLAAKDVLKKLREVNGEEPTDFAAAVKKAFRANPAGVIIGTASYQATDAPPAFAVCWARMVRDPLTGFLETTDIIETVDCGTVMNRNTVRGQIEGGVLQGLGYGQMEQMQCDSRTNKPTTSDLVHYRIPTAADTPHIHSLAVQSYELSGPLGAKSIGELTLVPVAAAMANCTESITGEKINGLPLSNKYMVRCAKGEDA